MTFPSESASLHPLLAPRRIRFGRLIALFAMLVLCVALSNTVGVIIGTTNAIAYKECWQPLFSGAGEIGTRPWRTVTGTRYTGPLRKAITNLNAATGELRSLNKELAKAVDIFPHNLDSRLRAVGAMSPPLYQEEYDALMAEGDNTPGERQLKQELAAAYNAFSQAADDFCGQVVRIYDHNTI